MNTLSFRHSRSIDEFKERARCVLDTELPVDGIVYAIGNIQQRIIKIGYSNNKYDRRNSIQTACPFDIEKFAEIPGSFALESRLHQLLADFHWRGEWFFLSDKALELVSMMQAIDEDKAKEDSASAAMRWDAGLALARALRLPTTA